MLLCSDNIICMLKMYHAGWRWGASGEQAVRISEAEIVSWTMKQLCIRRWDWDESTEWLGVSVEGRGPCGLNWPPGTSHDVRDGIQSTAVRGWRYNPGNRRLKVTRRYIFLRMNYHWGSGDTKSSLDGESWTVTECILKQISSQVLLQGCLQIRQSIKDITKCHMYCVYSYPTNQGSGIIRIAVWLDRVKH